jgi:PPOX class probable F420-dependent enzyme
VAAGTIQNAGVLPEPLATELLAAPLLANLATFNADRSVHLVPVWFLLDGRAIVIPTSGRSRKARNLEREPQATVMVHESRGGIDVRGLTLVGHAQILRGPEAVALNDRIHLKYVSARGLALESVRDFLASDDVTIRIVVERATWWDETGTDAARDLRASGEFVTTDRVPS